MKLRPFAPLAFLLACSSNTAAPAPDGAAPDAGVDAAGAYVDAVLAASWEELANGPHAPKGGKQDDVFFVTPSLGFAVNGIESAIYRTTDGGSNWAQVYVHKGTYFRSILFLDDKNGFAGNLGAGLSSSITDTNVLYRTTDGGDSWSPVTEITGDMPQGLCNLTAADKQHVFGVGRANGPAHLMASSDGGKTWKAQDLGAQMSMLIDAHFSSPTEGVIVGMNAGSPSVCTVMRTTNGGQSFDTVFSSQTPGSLCWKVQFPSANVGYVSVQDTTKGPGTFAKTMDGGKTWEELPLPIDGDPTSAYPALGIGFITDEIGWVASENSAQSNYRTVDGGKTWEKDATLTGPVNRFRFVDKGTAYAIGDAVWKLSIAVPGQ